ncbi:MAG: peptidoglycan-associated lipoprotein Pal [Verrucomicrobia bacterium]|nr:peptidoglycan-associated lipoprotein Pal [Verrucomicrobiota bacterium]
MKTRNYLNLLVCVLALTTLVTVGCKKKPVGVTPLPNAKSGGQVGDLPPGGILPGGENTGGMGNSGTGTSTTGFPAGPGHAGWSEDRAALQTETVYFDYDSSTIKGSEKSKIENVAAYLKSHGSAAVKVEGNCDERGTEEYNRALGERRALAIREYLINSGITPDSVDTVSYGEDKPAAPGHNEAAWKKNRRGEFVVLTAPK